MKRALALCLLLLSGSASADDGARVRRQLTLLLSGHHGPAPKAALEAVSPDAPRLVLELARSEATPILVRRQAFEALAHWPSDAARALWRGAAANEAAPLLDRQRGLLLLARTFGDAETPAIVPFLEHRAWPLRHTAATALATIGSPRARAALERLPEAKDPELWRHAERLLRERR